ncbi:hypothetical protein [Embleya sp. NBC_00896]|uniref:hypothetical protein n=1 Tax=Embleya sp. NBC_00896 TaxID=2975961 RepID=UPI002F907E1C|nr:hypothetical protein OG928_39145 [Embleya sp. NBC_00896]
MTTGTGMGMGPWMVVIEENGGLGQSVSWRVSNFFWATDHNDALRMAEHLAHTHRPMHPMIPQGRWALRRTDGSWLVIVPGTTTTYQFRVDIAEHVPYPGTTWTSPRVAGTT